MAGEFIFIGCKMPMGVVLNLDSYAVANERHGTVRRVSGKLKPVTLKGNALREGQPDLSIGGYVFTPVPKEFWDAWLKANKDSTLLADRFIMAANSEAEGEGMARELINVAGMAPRLVEKDPRVAGLGVETADEQRVPLAA